MRDSEDLALASAPRWRGTPGRTEVWYATLTDPATGTGLWVHHETVAPTPTPVSPGRQPDTPYGHGWIALFPPEGPPVCERFGPEQVNPAAANGAGPWFAAAGAQAGADRWHGAAGTATWDLHWKDPAAPLWTFPRATWSRELLPGAQVVLAPSAEFSGGVEVGGARHEFDRARGGVSHIYGHGNARRWGWVHADLDGASGNGTSGSGVSGSGDVLEVVTAVSMRPGLNRLPPLAFVRLRLDGDDWPGHGMPLLRARTRLGLPRWSVEGRAGSQRIRVVVTQPAERNVALEYVDPTGETAVCTNTERADIDVTIQRLRRGRWATERSWSLRGTGHAEVGLRGPAAPEPNTPRLGTSE